MISSLLPFDRLRAKPCEINFLKIYTPISEKQMGHVCFSDTIKLIRGLRRRRKQNFTSRIRRSGNNTSLGIGYCFAKFGFMRWFSLHPSPFFQREPGGVRKKYGCTNIMSLTFIL